MLAPFFHRTAGGCASVRWSFVVVRSRAYVLTPLGTRERATAGGGVRIGGTFLVLLGRDTAMFVGDGGRDGELRLAGGETLMDGVGDGGWGWGWWVIQDEARVCGGLGDGVLLCADGSD